MKTLTIETMNTRRSAVPLILVWALFGAGQLGRAAADQWQAADGPLMTRWAKEVSPDKVHPEYPRPQMVRGKASWTNLNGLWDYAIRPKDQDRPTEDGEWDGKILVPFCVESALSGVMEKVGPENRLWYRRWVPRSEVPKQGRLLLHFGACDWHTIVWVNGVQVGEHKGGYDPFTFDVTEAFGSTKSTRDEIVVAVWDPTDTGYQPRGKQVRQPRGIWYTSVTGIWQTVWLEKVPASRFQSLHFTNDIDAGTVTIKAGIRTDSDVQLRLRLIDGDTILMEADAKVRPRDGVAEVTLPVLLKRPKLWSPASPHLYDVRLNLIQEGKVIDAVASYFAMRKVEIKKDEDGINRIFLNNWPLFLYGTLDQGWWPDGLYTAPTDEALKYDIEVTRRLGFNLARKHVKVEPARWYYWCDKLGLLVWQDMPNGDRHIGRNDADLERSPESEATFRREWQAIIDARDHHPSIVAWVPFNEGWGQFQTNEILTWTKKHDPTRLVDGPSGWSDRGTGDMHDIHRYPGPAMPPLEETRAAVLGEFGGLGLPVEGHTWQEKENWGYRTFKTRGKLNEAYVNLLSRLHPLIGKGLAAAVYTQTTDVEIEVNGLMTYDRAVVKMDEQKARAAALRLFEPPPVIKPLVPAAVHEEKIPWRYTTANPGKGWQQVDFDASRWKKGPAGFGEPTTPGSIVGTKWKSADIWLRREFELKDVPAGLHLIIHHDEDAEVFINGVAAAQFDGYVTEYTTHPLSEEAMQALKPGRNVIAIHCHQTGGGQYIDAGLVQVIRRDE